jgi:hypothetical protein
VASGEGAATSPFASRRVLYGRFMPIWTNVRPLIVAGLVLGAGACAGNNAASQLAKAPDLPTFFINGEMVGGAQSIDVFREAVKKALGGR